MCTTILHFHRATHVFLIQNESFQQSLEEKKNNSEHEKRDNINNRVCSCVHSLMLETYINGLEIFKLSAFWPNILIWAEIPMGSFSLPKWKIFFPVRWYMYKLLGNGISRSFFLNLKCSHSFFTGISHLFFDSEA